MITEIGSEFWISDTATSNIKITPKWINSWGNHILTSSGRGAISLLLQKVHPKSKVALLPSYICESVVIPFLSQGYTCFFYDINEELEASIEDVNIYGDIGIFLHMGYFGFDTNSSLVHIIEILKRRSTIIIEDVTHTLFSDYTRNNNDYYFASIRKWMGLPSGGFLASPQMEVSSVLSNNYTFSNIRKQALVQKYKYIKGSNVELKPQMLKSFAEAEEVLDEDVLPYNIDKLSASIINDCDIINLKNKRRKNFECLLGELSNSEFIRSVFKKLPKHVCPLFYPVYINGDRMKIRKHLTDNKIYCPIHWPIPNQVKGHLKDKVKDIYDTILSIPCDQRYGIDDMRRIIKVINEFT